MRPASAVASGVRCAHHGPPEIYKEPVVGKKNDQRPAHGKIIAQLFSRKHSKFCGPRLGESRAGRKC